MTPPRLIFLTTLTMIAFAANSVLCRMALKETALDAASFTSLRLFSGAAMLWLLMRSPAMKPAMSMVACTAPNSISAPAPVLMLR